MLEILILVLIVLFLTGNIHINGFSFPHTVLFAFNGRPVTLINLLIFFVILWAIGVLPSPFREIAGVLFVLWLLALLGFIAIAGLSNLLVIAIIAGIVIAVLKR